MAKVGRPPDRNKWPAPDLSGCGSCVHCRSIPEGDYKEEVCTHPVVVAFSRYKEPLWIEVAAKRVCGDADGKLSLHVNTFDMGADYEL